MPHVATIGSRPRLLILAGLSFRLMILLGLAGIVLPALPGVVLVWAGILVGAWADGFVHVGWGILAACTALMLFALLVDLLAGVLGAKRLNAHWLALVGA